MRKILLSITFVLFSLNYYAQENITIELENACNTEKFDFIISEHSEKASQYPARAVYYIGMSYYMKSDDNNALKFMDLSIEKDNTDPDAHYIKGMTYNYMGKFEKAIESFDKAIALDSSNTHFFSGLGDSYISQEKYYDALSAYISATQKTKPIDRPFTMIPQIYATLNQPEKALQAFYKSKEVISKESDSYVNALYNIGLYELLNKEYDKAEVALKELIELAPNDFQSFSKLIQVYYGKKEYKKAEPYKRKLYQAYDQGILEGNLTEMFCFDQFNWGDKLILGFERFAVKEGQLYYKHVFYVTNQETGESEFTIQTENSPIAVQLGGTKYVIGMDKDGTHSTFRFGFDEDFEYDDLKKVVILILEEKIKAGASSRKG